MKLDKKSVLKERKFVELGSLLALLILYSLILSTVLVKGEGEESVFEDTSIIKESQTLIDKPEGLENVEGIIESPEENQQEQNENSEETSPEENGETLTGLVILPEETHLQPETEEGLQPGETPVEETVPEEIPEEPLAINETGQEAEQPQQSDLEKLTKILKLIIDKVKTIAGEALGIKAKLSYSNGSPVAGEEVGFYYTHSANQADAQFIGGIVTDAEGLASIELDTSGLLGEYVIGAKSGPVSDAYTIEVVEGKKVEIRDKEGNTVDAETDIKKVGEGYDVTINPKNELVDEIIFEGLRIENTAQFWLSEITSPIPPENVTFAKAYAIDFSGLEFASASLSSTAEESSLYKCRDFNFSQETCEGSWEKIQDLTKGERYVIALSPNDPGFAEGFETVEEIVDETLNNTITNQSLIFEETITQGTAEINRPVIWFKEVSVKNENDIEITAQIKLESPEEATSIRREYPDSFGVQSLEFSETFQPGEEKTFNLSYETPGPIVSEELLGNKKIVTVSSGTHYENILTYTSIAETPKDGVRVYWLSEGSKHLIDANYLDTNEDGLVDKVEWVTPSLSSQTFEVVAVDIEKIRVYREQPNIAGAGKEVEVRFSIWNNNSVEVKDLEIVDIFPDTWQVVSKPSNAIVFTDSIIIPVNDVLPDGLASISYTLKSPQAEETKSFRGFVNASGVYKLIHGPSVEVNMSKGAFDTEIDLSTEDDMLTKTAYLDEDYTAEFKIKNVGTEVKKYETYYQWVFNPELWSVPLETVSEGCGKKKIVDYGNEKAIVCEWQVFHEGETKTFTARIQPLRAGEGLTSSNTTYDPPFEGTKNTPLVKIAKLVTSLLSKLKTFIIRVWSEIVQGELLGQVVRDVKKDLQENATKPTAQGLADNEGKPVDAVLTGSNKTEKQDAQLSIEFLTPKSGIVLYTFQGYAKCKSSENKKGTAYTLRMFYDNSWHLLCKDDKTGLCAYDLSGVAKQAGIMVECTAVGLSGRTASKTNTGIELNAQGRNGEESEGNPNSPKPEKPEKVWITTLEDHFFRVREKPLGEAEITQSSAEIGLPVEWAKKIGLNGNGTEQEIRVVITKEAFEISAYKVKDGAKTLIGPDLVTVLDNSTDKEILFTDSPAGFVEYQVVYHTSAPEKTEQESVQTEKQWVKQLDVSSNSSSHYSNVLSYTGIISSKPEQVHMYLLDGLNEEEITHDTDYNLTLKDTDNDGLMDEIYWLVPQLSTKTFVIKIITAADVALEFKDSNDNVLDVEASLYENGILVNQTSSAEFLLNLSKTYDLSVKFSNSPVRQIDFAGLEYYSDFNGSIGIDDPPESSGPPGGEWEEVYAVNPSSMNFSNATMTVTGKGKELYKCADWDFENRACLGLWKRIKSLAPGENYTFLLTKADPGFADGNINFSITPLLSSDKGDYQADESATFDFEYITSEEIADHNISLDNSSKPKSSKVWEADYEKIETFIQGRNSLVEAEIEEVRQGKFQISLPSNIRSFKAGAYKLILNLTKDNVTYTQEQDFTWGVLAVNTHKSAYLPSENSFIGMAVLDDMGRMVCDADVTLTITDPSSVDNVFMTSDGGISVSDECSIYGVTNLPDYYMNYTVGGSGVYVMNLTAVTANGVRSVIDSFIVQDSVRFDVARQGPTRIYPLVPYTMNFTIISNENYNGEVKEYVPASFAITPQAGLTVTTSGDTKILAWNMKLVTGNTYNLGYEFDAPDISPYLFILGDLDIGTWSELRQWQIASDAITTETKKPTDYDDAANPDQTTNPTDAYDSDANYATSYSYTSLGANANPSIVFYTWDANSSNYDMLSLNVTISVTGTIPASPDEWQLDYTTDGGTNWTVWPGYARNASNMPQHSISLNLDPNQRLDLLQIRVQTWKNGGGDTRGFNFFDIWTEGTYDYVAPAGSPPTITINTPKGKSTYDYSDSTNNKAYSGETNNEQPPSSLQTTGTEPSPYSDLATNDDNRWASLTSGTNGLREHQSFKLLITDTITDVTSIDLTWIGYCLTDIARNADICRFYIWNETTSGYSQLSSTSASASDSTLSVNIPSSFADYIDADGYIWLLIQANTKGTGGPSALSEVRTNYISVGVNKIETLSGSYTVNVTTSSADAISSCDYRYENETYASGWIGLINTTQDENDWTNTSDTTSDPPLADMYYNFTVNCTTVLDASTIANTTVAISNAGLTVTNLAPDNASATWNNTITFQWNATHPSEGIISCNLTLDGQVNNTNAISKQSGSLFDWLVENVGDGLHYWNATCWKVGGATTASSTWEVTVDTTAPTIGLIRPYTENWTNVENMTFFYIPADSSLLSNCTFVLDDFLNETNATEVIKDVENNFTISLVSEGFHNWTVNCTDTVNNIGTNGTVWNFTVDWTLPWIDLNEPPNNTFITTDYYTFNWTAYDNLDNNLTCNLTVNDVVKGAYVESTNGTPQTYDVTGLLTGWNEWNLTCWDNATNTNNSGSYFVFVNLPPTTQHVAPENDNWSNVENVTFFYTPSDDFGFNNCSVILDDFLNETNATAIINGSVNNITVDLIGEGWHNWTVNCTDSSDTISGNKTLWNFTIDWTLPDIEPDGPENNSLLTSSSDYFNWTATDNLDENLTCNLMINNVVKSENVESDNGTLTNVYVTELSGGWNEWNVTCWDNATNTNTSFSRFFTFASAPVISLLAPANDNWSNVENVTFFYQPFDESGFTNCTLTLDDYLNETNTTEILNNVENNLTADLLSEGFHNWTVNCTDNDLNEGTNTTSWNFTLDWTLPQINLSEPWNDTQVDVGTIDFNWTAEDNLDEILSCNLVINDVVRATNVDSPNGTLTNVNIVGLDGINEWNVTCWDNASNYNSSDSFFLIADEPPNVTLISPENENWTNIENVTFFYNVQDNVGLSNCTLILDNELNESNTTEILNNQENNLTAENLAEGLHNWTVQCKDTAENIAINESYWNFTVDWTLPWIDLNEPPNNTVITTDYSTFNWTAYDNFDDNLTCNLTINNIIQGRNIESTNGTPQTYDATGLLSGWNEWNVTCWDNATNMNITGSYFAYADLPPTTEFTAPENDNWSNVENVTFFYTPSDDFGFNNCSVILDDFLNETNATGIINGSVNNITVDLIGEGWHNWTVNCTDSYNSEGGNNTLWNFTLDWTLPNAALDSPIPYYNTTQTSLVFNFTATDNLDENITCNLTLDSEINVSYIEANNGIVAETTISNLGNGEHEWNVTCWDNATNTNVSESRYFNVNLVPTLTLEYPEDEHWNISENLTFTYYVYDIDGLDNCTFVLDGELNETNATAVENGANNSFEIYNIAEAFHNWTVRCADPGMGEATASPVRTFYVDQTYPSANLTSPENNSDIHTSAITFKWVAEDNLDTVLNCSVIIDDIRNNTEDIYSNHGIETSHQAENFSEGWHEWNVSCEDNVSLQNTSDSFFFYMNSSPVIEINFPPDDYWVGVDHFIANYTPTDNDALIFCLFYLDDLMEANASDPLIENNEPNYHTYENSGEGTHNWAVSCNDTAQPRNEVFSDTRNFTIDLTEPWIDLNLPENSSEAGTLPVTFNWMAFDNLDENLICNLTINNNLSTENTGSLNGSYTTQDVSQIYDGINEWNVTCWDEANNSNTSVSYFLDVNVEMNVTILEPYNDNWTNIENVTFFYNITDNDIIDNCTIILDEFLNETNKSEILKGELNNFTVELIGEGFHNWTVNCTTVSDVKGTYEPLWNITVDQTNATIDLNSPEDFYNTSSMSVMLNWTATDNLDENLTCSLTIDESVNHSGVESTSGIGTAETVENLAEGYHLWNVTCADNATNTNVSATYKFTVDASPPVINLGVPENDTWTNQVNVTFYFAPSEQYTDLVNCTVILNSVMNETNITLENGIENSIDVALLGDDYYEWTVNCTDLVNNEGTNITYRQTLYVDTSPPDIDLNYPYETQTFNEQDILFNFTAYDNLATNITCNLSIDDKTNLTELNATTNISYSETVENIAEGGHNWSVVCWDTLNNTNTSILVNFTVNQPDFTLNDTDLDFNNTNPEEGENITINATVYNIGGQPASNILVTFLDNEDEIGNYTIASLNPAGDNLTVNMTWNVSIGYHVIWVLIDPELGIAELNETNNNVSKVFTTLSANVTYPPNETWTYDPFVEFNFTLYDYLNATMNYTVFLDGLVNESGNTTDANETSVNFTLLEGIHLILVEASEEDPLLPAPAPRNRNSSEITVYADLTGPVGVINTLNDTWFNVSSPEINFTITDNLDIELNFTFYVNETMDDGTILENMTVPNTTEGKFYNLTGQGEGIYELVLEAIEETGNRTNSSSITIFIDWTEPNTTLESPVDYFNTSNSSVDFNWSVTDNMDPALDCNLTIDDSFNITDVVLENGTYTLQMAENIAEGSHLWNVTCWDNATNINTSDAWVFTVDRAAPIVTLGNPENETYYNIPNVTFFFTPSELTTQIENCTLILDGAENETLTEVLNAEENNITASLLSDGTHVWTVNCTDIVNNIGANLSEKTVYVDTELPAVNLDYPLTDTNLTSSTVDFNFTSTDNFDINITCNLTIDGEINVSGIDSPNNTLVNQSVSDLSDGFHEWNVTCWDDADNSNASETRNFTVYTIEMPFGLIATLNGYDLQSIDVNWTNVSKSEYFNIYITWNYSDGFPAVPNYTGITDLNFTDPYAKDSMEVYYKVSVVNGPSETMSNQTVGKFDLNLDSGYNLVSMPLNLTYQELGNNSVVGSPLPTDPQDAILYVYQYNTSDDFYEYTQYDIATQVWAPAAGSNNFTMLDMLHGYWFETSVASRVTFVGEIVAENITIPLNNSYNVVGWPTVDARLLGDESIIDPLPVIPDDSITAIDRYNNFTDSYEVTIHYPSYGWVPSANNPGFEQLEPGLGYFFDAVVEANWTHDPYTWD